LRLILVVISQQLRSAKERQAIVKRIQVTHYEWQVGEHVSSHARIFAFIALNVVTQQTFEHLMHGCTIFRKRIRR